MTTEAHDGRADDPGDDENGGEQGDDGGRSNELTYATAGVDIDASEAATAALVGAAGGGDGTEDAEQGYAGLVDLGEHYLGLATDGVGTKLLVAEALNHYSTIGIDCVAMNVNDLVAAGVKPLAFVDYLAVADPDEEIAAEVGAGLKAGAERSDVQLVGGETAVMPEVVRGVDLAGTCAGLVGKDEVFSGEAEAGDALVGFRSSGIHSNGLTLARKAVTREHGYTDPVPWEDESESGRTIGEVLLEPTRIYTHLLSPLREHGTRAAAHVTGGGWTNLTRMGDRRYEITDPFSPQPVFEFIEREGNVSDSEMYSTFNMGTGFVAALSPENADALCADTDGRVIGHVEDGSGVAIAGLVLE